MGDHVHFQVKIASAVKLLAILQGQQLQAVTDSVTDWITHECIATTTDIDDSDSFLAHDTMLIVILVTLTVMLSRPSKR